MNRKVVSVTHKVLNFVLLKVGIFSIILAFSFWVLIFLICNNSLENHKSRPWHPTATTFKEYNDSQLDNMVIKPLTPRPLPRPWLAPTPTPVTSSPINRIVIGAVSCRNGSDMTYYEETVVMLKSVVISAKLDKISEIDIHMFLEYMEEDELYYREKLESLGYHIKKKYTDRHGLKINFIAHSALEAIPKEYHIPMIYHRRYRCAWVRFFFPTALPEVDAIIHLDSDMIITGSLKKLWNNFFLMTGEQLVGAGRGNELTDRNYQRAHAKWFNDIPHPPPMGVNAGLQLMNLTRMREYKWESKLLRVYNDYSKLVNLTGQRTFNIMLYYDPGLLHELSCRFNFFHRHCERGFTCNDAVEDGIQLLHGNGKKMEVGKVLHGVFEAYQQFNLSEWIGQVSVPTEKYEDGLIDSIKNSLMTPIRAKYTEGPNPCFGTLNHLLFKSFYRFD